MDSSSRDDRWNEQAGEFVLGLLDDEQQRLFEELLKYDLELQQAVLEWEHRLQPLADALPEQNPSHLVWQAIQRRLADEPQTTKSQADKQPTAVSLHQDSGTREDPAIAYIPSRDPLVRRWQRNTGLALVASIALVSILLHQFFNQSAELDRGTSAAVSVVLNDASAALWIVDVSAEEPQLSITAVAPPPLEGAQSHELWIVLADGAGVQSLGVLPDSTGQELVVPLTVESLNRVRSAAALAVSLEPEGGSPLSEPSGPVLYQGTVQIL